MERVLTTHEATVQTVQVEIKALKVGKKQVTMGLFRQLPYARLIDPKTVQLRGVPWGHVNYWWEGDGSGFGDGRKLHVVWQLGEELRRAVIFEEPDPAETRRFEQQIRDLVGDWVIVRLASAHSFKLVRADRFSTSRTAELDDHGYTVTFDEALVRTLDTYWANRDIDPAKEAERQAEYMRQHSSVERAAETYADEYRAVTARKADARRAYLSVLEARGLLEISADKVLEQLRAGQAEYQAYRDTWAKHWQVLRTLPQLFIAV